jgi:hypothetical protein
MLNNACRGAWVRSSALLTAVLAAAVVSVGTAQAQGTGAYPDAEGARCADVPYGGFRPAEPGRAPSLGDAVYVTPPNPAGPTVVDIGLSVFEITDVDLDYNTFSMEAFLDLLWCDPRLAAEATEAMPTRFFLEHDAQLALDQIWWPDIEIVNETRRREIEHEQLVIHPDGTVIYRERFNATMAARYDLRAFPFDTQILEVEMRSLAFARDVVIFHEAAAIGFSTDFHLPEWTISGLDTRVEARQLARDTAPFSEFLAEITVVRDPGFYVTRVIVPLTVIILLATIVYWMDGKALGERVRVSFTGLLTAVAYQFTTADALPQHVYNSYLDAVVALSLVVMVFSIVESLVVSRYVRDGRQAIAVRVDVTARWMVPGAYLAGLAALFFVYTA